MTQAPVEIVDPIGLELLRSGLDAIGDEAAAAIVRAAISPVVTESKDYSIALLDADGRIIAGRPRPMGVAAHVIRSTIARYGEDISPGDVFIANDPHNGGGLHPQDVQVQRPIFLDGRRVAWVSISAHMMDFGGMTPGSFSREATECYAECLRLPPVRFFKAGVEVTDVWDIIRNNVRVSELVEMDLRALVAGCHVAHDKVAALVETMGADGFTRGIAALRDLTEQEIRRRVRQIADGTYRTTSWAEWGEEFLKLACTLTVDGDRLIFDFDGTSPQAPHYFNSKPYIIEAQLAGWLHGHLALDLPFNQGMFSVLEVRCPEGSLLNSRPPAPIGASHIDVATHAVQAARHCVRLALEASPDAPTRRLSSGWGGLTLALQTWACTGIDGQPDAWIMLDGNFAASSAAVDRDGLDFTWEITGPPTGIEVTDVEVLESWYPILITEKRVRPGAEGAGRQRAGGGCQMKLTPHGTDQLEGTMLGMRRWLPLQGAAGGLPGAPTQFRIHAPDGSIEEIPLNASAVDVLPGQVFEFRCGSGGGYGDPLDRTLEAVKADVDLGRISAAEALRVYGAVVAADGTVDVMASEERRAQERRHRLAKARPAVRPVAPRNGGGPAAGELELPIYPGVVQRGSYAVCEQSGAVLAVVPDHWTDGCPVLEERESDLGPEVVMRTYLDPLTGRALYVEDVPAGEPRSFETSPAHWTGSR